LFVLIGAQPRTEWLGEAVARDRQGFIRTGPDLPASTRARWPADRPPLELETSLPGVFAVGDVRRGSVKRVASAVGEGAATIPLVHRYLARAAAGRGTPHRPAPSPVIPASTRPGPSRRPLSPNAADQPASRPTPVSRAYREQVSRCRCSRPMRGWPTGR